MYDMIHNMENLLKNAIKDLCLKANTEYNSGLYKKITELYQNTKSPEYRKKTGYILNNIKLAYDTKRPLCQDTGTVIVFLTIGTRSITECLNFTKIINDAVALAYKENFFRKSVVKNALSDRTNTENNTPVIIYTDFDDTEEIKVDVLIKGAGSENMSAVKMFPPSVEKIEIFNFIKETIEKAGERACPPVVAGIGFAGTIDAAAAASKRAFFESNEQEFCKEFLDFVKDENILDIRTYSASSHIASLAAAISLSCHCTRHASCIIKNGKVYYKNEPVLYHGADIQNNAKEVFADDITALGNLAIGEEILLTGEILTARDAAHKRFKENLESGKELPFEIKDRIIFYAGPCPAKTEEITGPTGPTTAYRMDKYCELMHSHGLLGSIGKGERTQEGIAAIKKYNGRYFTAAGGISCVLAQCVKSSEIIAFEDLGTEAVRKIYVEKLPLRVEI